ncbi:hypothetical protein CGJ08_23475 [Vibrio parahaemolyticus]|nr:hypothetical protein CGJ08_23475 [Vibrio parahaemolyticus]
MLIIPCIKVTFSCGSALCISFVFVKSSGNVPEAFKLKFDAVVIVETQPYQVVCPKAYVLAEVLLSLVLCVSSALQSKIAERLSLTKVHQYT